MKVLPWVFGLGVLLIALAGSNKTVRGMVMEPRGIRNNNPGNIRHGSNWQGMADDQQDKSFVSFVSPVYGIRALARVLHTYVNRHGLLTVRGIIERWAPPIENDTESYVQSVAGKLGVVADERLLFSPGQIATLVEAIIKHENGKQPYGRAVIEKGIQMAGWV